MIINAEDASNKRFILKNWRIVPYNKKGYFLHGYIYNNPIFKNGKSIDTTSVVDIVTCENGYIAHTLHSVYFLPKESYAGDKSLQKILNSFYAVRRKVFTCAEKLLAEGDCLYCEHIVFYRAKSGIVSLKLKNIPYRYSVYEYADENFELRVYKTDSFYVHSDKSHMKCAMYQIDFETLMLKKTDYLLINVPPK